MKNFESWRQRKMSYFAHFDGEMHFHRCSDYTYGCVAHFLQSLLAYRVQHGSPQVNVTISEEFANAALSFLDEMKFGYIHPRSTSHKMLMLGEERGAKKLQN